MLNQARPYRLVLFIGLLSLMLSEHALAAITKNWSSNYPVTGSVTIPAGETVVLDANLNLNNLTILGNLVCANKDLNIQSRWILVKGSWECGNWKAHYLHKLNLTLTDANTGENVAGMGTKFLGVLSGGKIFFKGVTRKMNWTRLTTHANKGATSISLQGNAAGNIDWKPGEKIVIASTDFRAEHAEQLTIASVSGNKVNFSTPLQYNHVCQHETYSTGWHMSECAEVGLLSHNITIQGDTASDTTGFGGHIMVMKGGNAKLVNVELFRMGQKGLIGRYPMHWHMVGAAPDQYLTDSSIHHAYNRFVSVHGTHQLNLLRNVAYDTRGHGFYLEDGIEEKNTLYGNLGLLVRNATDGKPTPSDNTASVFWISNPNNIIRSNVAAGSEHTGFWLGFPEHPIGLSATNTLWPRRTPLAEFNANISHSNIARGLYVDGGENADRTVGTTWYEPRSNPADANSALITPAFKNFSAYKNRFEGVWIRSFAGPLLTGAKLADNWMGAYFANITSGPTFKNIGIIENSLVIGETANRGNPEVWETKGIDSREIPHFWSPNDSIRGLEFYDGPMGIRKSLFVNFQSNSQRKSGGLTSLAPNPYWVSSLNFSEQVGFVNANRVYLHDLTDNNSGDAFSTFRDKDGSVSGVAGGMIVPKNPVLVTSLCGFRASWNAYVCPHEYVTLGVHVHDSGNYSRFLLKRDDGASINVASPAQFSNQLNVNLITGRPHNISFSNGTPKHVSFIVSEKAGKSVRLTLPYPTANFTATRWGWPIEKAANLAALSTGGHKYFYDGINLHLRLVSETGSWEEIEIKRP